MVQFPDNCEHDFERDRLHKQHMAVVSLFYERCKSLGVEFGRELLMAAKIDALANQLLGPHEVNMETGELLEGNIPRIKFEIEVAEIMLSQLESDGVAAALDVSPIIMPNGVPMNRAQRRGQPSRRRR